MHWAVNSQQPIGAQGLADAMGVVATGLLREAGLEGRPHGHPHVDP